jgi:hypothetical protein
MIRTTAMASAAMLLALAGCASRQAAAPGPVAAGGGVPAGVDAGMRTSEGPVIVRLAGKNHATITVTSGPGGPRYSAREADGRVIVRGATLGELQASHPELAKFVTPGIAVHADAGSATGEPATSRGEIMARDEGPEPFSGAGRHTD